MHGCRFCLWFALWSRLNEPVAKISCSTSTHVDDFSVCRATDAPDCRTDHLLLWRRFYFHDLFWMSTHPEDFYWFVHTGGACLPPASVPREDWGHKYDLLRAINLMIADTWPATTLTAVARPWAR